MKRTNSKLILVLAQRLCTMLLAAVIASANAWAACDRFDYSGEFVVSNFQLIDQTVVAPDLVQMTVSADIQNTDSATLDAATATPDFSASAQDVVVYDPLAQPWSFGSVGPLETLSSDPLGNLTVTVPADQVSALLQEFVDGTVGVQVHGNERLVLKPNVYALAWSDTADANYRLFGNIGFYGQLHLFDGSPLQDTAALDNMSWFVDLAAGSGPNICVGSPLPGDAYYVYENAASGSVDQAGLITGQRFPVLLRHARLNAVVFESGATTASECQSAASSAAPGLRLQFNDAQTWDILGAVERGTFCSDDSIYLDQPVAQTRFVVDSPGYETPLDDNPDVLARDTQPVRLDGLQLGDLRVSGQVQGYALKPSIAVRVKPQGLEVRAGVESDLSIALQVTADADIASIDQTGVQLANLCFPLPPVPLGFAMLESSFELGHTLDVSAQMKAGVTLGIQKQFRGGYSMGWDPARPSGDEFFSASHFSERPLTLTPPRLVDDSATQARVATNFQGTLNLNSSTCLFGGPFVRATLAGSVRAAPLETPWWTLEHDAQLAAGLSFELFGISLLERSAPLVTFPGSESLSAPAARGGGAVAAGLDQRWAVNVQDLGSPGGKIWVTDVAAVADGGAVAITSNGSGGGAERLLRFDANGQLVWDLQYAGISTHVSEVALSGDDIVIAGDENGDTGFWLAAHDAAGAELWNRKLAVTNADGDTCSLDALVSFTDETQTPGLLLAGTSGSTTNQTTRPCLARLAADGTPLWSRVAGQIIDAGDGTTAEWRLYDAIATRDGGFLLVGYFHLRPAGDFLTTKPIATKIDGQGNAQWQRIFAIPDPAARVGAFKAVDQADSGEFYLTGSIGGTVLQTGGLLVATLSEDGQDGKGAIVYYSKLPQGSPDDSNDGPNHWSYTSDIAESGNDTGLDIVTVDGGAILTAQLGVRDEAWMIRVNEHLGVEWFNHYDGVFQDSFTSIARSQGGLLAAGPSQSIIPNTALGGLAGKSTLMLMKLPYEGLVDSLHPALDMYRRYILPTVFQGPELYANSPMIQPEGDTLPLPLVAGTVVDNGSNPGLLQTPSAICASLLTTASGVPSPDYLCDADGDGVDDIADNCQAISNADQLDLDGDGEGDVCDDDVDGDSVANDTDNCLNLFNPAQIDTNGDGYGNRCDPDLDNNGLVNVVDLGLFKAAFFGAPGTQNWNPDADFDGNDSTNVIDLGILKTFFFLPPGPSGLVP